MPVDLDGLAVNIKGALRGERREEWAFMVDELIQNLKDREADVERLRTALTPFARAFAEGPKDSRWGEALGMI